jgi:hypothetical protein
MDAALPAALNLTAILTGVKAILSHGYVKQTMIMIVSTSVSGWIISSMRKNWDRRNRYIKRKAGETWDKVREKRNK